MQERVQQLHRRPAAKVMGKVRCMTALCTQHVARVGLLQGNKRALYMYPTASW